MTFNEYQKAAMKTDSFSRVERDLMSDGFINKVLGVCGETGEFADKIKKLRRNKGHGQIDEAEVIELSKELGDVLWYLATLADYLGVSFDEVAKMNVEKLADRAKRNKINSAGDNR